MNTLLIYLAFPIAVIIFSIVLEKLLNNPIIVAALIFAAFLVVTFAAFDENFLIATFAYTVLSFITALITKLLSEREENEHNLWDMLEQALANNSENNSVCDTVENFLGNNTNNNSNTSNCGCGCNRYRRWKMLKKCHIFVT